MVTATIAVVGAGPAGLMAAERLATAGHRVLVFDRMASPARKFLLAGRGGLNLTHSEPSDRFLARYGAAAPALRGALDDFTPAALVAWVNGLGIETFTGTSCRVFPRVMKASPLLRAWLRRLEALGVQLRLRHDWRGFDAAGALRFETPDGTLTVAADAAILALGGASWPRLGSDGGWVPILAHDGVAISPLAPANCAVTIAWSPTLIERCSGQPLKRIAVSTGGTTTRGEAIVTRTGLEGGAIYALAARVRDQLTRDGAAFLTIDLRPDMTAGEIAGKLARPRAKQSAATFLRKSLALSPAAIALLREPGPLPTAPEHLAARIKSLALTATGCAGLDRAISTAGGVAFSGLDARLMLRSRAGTFVCGEMLDWEAPTGGYLLQATFATAVLAADGCARWLADRPRANAAGQTPRVGSAR